ncbi:Scaffold-type E3 ligase [Maublancomyces gigas]|uniref:Defective in cullin neddylation protein n=1 Tax=Discina gigas TaxID=1032678 RepID=A0ABR3GMA7_9PEZI
MSRRLNRYFTSNNAPPTPASTSSVASLNKIFDSYREQGDPPNIITVNGAMKYLQDIDIGLEEPTILVIAELLQAPTMGEFAREGFVDGWKTSGCDTLDKMRARVPDLRFAFSHDEALFKKVYLFTYNFARSPNQKSLPLESATEYWKLLFAKRFKTHMGNWIDFLETEYKRSIAKDTWNCMYDFVQLADGDPTLASYDTDGAWPSILDDFVGYVRKKQGAVMDIS